jgi:hypothetical protein
MEELDRENKTAINLLKLGKVDEACVHVNNAWNFLNYVVTSRLLLYSVDAVSMLLRPGCVLM